MKTFICLLFIACLPAYAQDYIEWSKPFNYSVHDVRYSPDEKTIAVANNDTITILSADDGHLIKNIPTTINIEQLLFTPDGKSIIVRAYKYIYVWNIEQGKLEDSIMMNYSRMPSIVKPRCMSLSANGELLAATFSGNKDSTFLVVVEVKTGKELLFKEGTAYRMLQFTHDGKKLIVIRSDQYIDKINDPTIEIYNTENFSMSWYLLSEKKIKNLYVLAMDISYNDSLLAIATEQGAANIWIMDLETKTITSPISTKQYSAVNRMRFCPDNKNIFVGQGAANFMSFNAQTPLTPYIFKDSLAEGGGGRGIDCSQKDSNIISSSGITVVKYNSTWQAPVGVQEKEEKQDSVLFPNPTNGYVTIKIFYSLITPVNINIVDIKGNSCPINIAKYWEGNNFIVSFNAGLLVVGKYLVQLQTNCNNRTFTFIKE